MTDYQGSNTQLDLVAVLAKLREANALIGYAPYDRPGPRNAGICIGDAIALIEPHVPPKPRDKWTWDEDDEVRLSHLEKMLALPPVERIYHPLYAERTDHLKGDYAQWIVAKLRGAVVQAERDRLEEMWKKK